MKKLFILLLLISQVSYAECDFKTGITKNSDGSYNYTRDCHIRVGETVQENENLKKSIDLKDLAIQKQEDRITLWSDTSYKLEQRVNAIEEMKSKNDFLYFGLGVLATVGTAFAVSRVIK